MVNTVTEEWIQLAEQPIPEKNLADLTKLIFDFVKKKSLTEAKFCLNVQEWPMLHFCKKAGVSSTTFPPDAHLWVDLSYNGFLTINKTGAKERRVYFPTNKN